MSEIPADIIEEANSLYSSLITPFHFGYNRILEDADKEKLANFITYERQRSDSLKALCDEMAKALEEAKFALFSGDMTIKDRADQAMRLALEAYRKEKEVENGQ